jgi:hypothetical protein
MAVHLSACLVHRFRRRLTGAAGAGRPVRARRGRGPGQRARAVPALPFGRAHPAQRPASARRVPPARQRHHARAASPRRRSKASPSRSATGSMRCAPRAPKSRSSR